MKQSKLSCYLIAGLCAFGFFNNSAVAAEESPVELSIGSIRTEAEAAAVGILVKYAEEINEETFDNVKLLINKVIRIKYDYL